MRTSIYLLPTLFLLNWKATITSASVINLSRPDSPFAGIPSHKQHGDILDWSLENNKNQDLAPGEKRTREIHNADYESKSPSPPPNADSSHSTPSSTSDAVSAPATTTKSKPQSNENHRRSSRKGATMAAAGTPNRQGPGPQMEPSRRESSSNSFGTPGTWTSYTRANPAGVYAGDGPVQFDSSHISRTLRKTEGGWWKRLNSTTQGMPAEGHARPGDIHVESKPAVADSQDRVTRQLPANGQANADGTNFESNHLLRDERPRVARGLPAEAYAGADSAQLDTEHVKF